MKVSFNAARCYGVDSFTSTFFNDGLNLKELTLECSSVFGLSFI